MSLFKPHENDADGVPYPTLRCLFPEPPPQGLVANCAEAGVLGPIAGVVGTLQATEVVKEILGLGESLAGRLLIYDALTCRFEIVTVAWDPDNPLSGTDTVYCGTIGPSVPRDPLLRGGIAGKEASPPLPDKPPWMAASRAAMT